MSDTPGMVPSSNPPGLYSSRKGRKKKKKKRDGQQEEREGKGKNKHTAEKERAE